MADEVIRSTLGLDFDGLAREAEAVEREKERPLARRVERSRQLIQQQEVKVRQVEQLAQQLDAKLGKRLLKAGFATVGQNAIEQFLPQGSEGMAGFLTNTAENIVQGALFGGPAGAIVGAIASTIGQLTGAVRRNEENLKRVRENLAELGMKQAEFRRLQELKLLDFQRSQNELEAEIKELVNEKYKELLAETFQYVKGY